MPTISPKVTPYYGGGQVVNPANVIKTSGAPPTTLTQDNIGTMAVDNAAGNIYGLASKSGGVDTWVLMGSSSGTITGVAGTANQITVNTASNIATISLPSAITAPGSLSATTSLSAGTSVTAGTSITATLGNITATNGNLVLTAAGNKMIRSSVGTTTSAGANSIGTVTLVAGTATVATTAVTANSLIRTWRQSVGATGANPVGNISVGIITAGTSFVIGSVNPSDASAFVATDVSVVGWEIIN